MKQFYLFAKKYDLIYFAIILSVMIAFFYFLGLNINTPFSDIGREFYIPFRMNQGAVLYKDIINIYAPLGYILNAFLLKIFGSGLNTFLFTGFFLSYFSLVLIFQINKFFFKKIIALLLTIGFIPSCVFSPSLSNWITPYSYSLIWAIFGILISIFCLFKFLSNNKFKYIFLSFLFYGFSISCKYDFAFFIILLSTIVFIKRFKLKTVLMLFAATLIFPALCVCVLLLQKCSFNDLYTAYCYISKLAKSNAVNYFYHFYGFIPGFNSLKQINYALLYPRPTNFFVIIGYISFVLIIRYIVIFIKNKQLNQKDCLILCFLLSGFLTAIKCIGSINLYVYGSYFFPILLSSVLAVVYKKENFIYLFCIIFFTFYTVDCFQKNLFEEINIGKINIKVKPVYISGIKILDNYIQENIKRTNKTLLLLPEGSIINYAEEIKSNDKYFILNPAYNEIFNSGEVLNYIKNNKIDYIVFTNILYSDYPYFFFKSTYGKDIYEYVKSNYKYEITAGEKIQFEIYKLPE